MRILSIRFKNLNSLVGEWNIDLTHPAYLSDGIFAITGPTGAGKTTILDAVCLALYGRTPRLPRITKNENELMSRQKGECFAEVSFEVGTGTFRCHWAQWRARKKAEGDLQPPRHELSDALSGRVIESNLRGVAEKVEALTGMDFDRFTRSMLLAQGGFAAFLQAPPDQRSPILEQLTGTEIYSTISRRVHERLVAERSRFEALEAELSGIHLLDEDEALRLHAELESQREQIQHLEQQAEQTRLALRWLEGLEGLQNELTELEKRRRELEARSEAFEPERRTLHRATRALELAGEYAGLVSLRRAQEQDTRQARATAEALPACEAARTEAQTALDAATTAREQARVQREQGLCVVRAVRELDAAIRGKDAALESLQREGTARETALEEIRDAARQHRRNLEAARAEQALVLAMLRATTADQTLVENLSALRQRFEQWRQTANDAQNALCAATQAAARQQEAATAHGRLLALCDEQRQALSRLEAAAALQQTQLNDCLGTQTLADWHAQLLHLTTRLGLLDKAEEAARQREALLQTLQDGEQRQTAHNQTEQACRQRLEQAEQHCRGLEAECATLEARRDADNRLHALAEARKELHEGQPCPLCGAPYHAETRPDETLLPDAEQAGETLSRLRERLRQAETERAAAHSELAGLGRERAWMQEHRQTTLRTLEEQGARLRDTLSRLDLRCEEEETPDSLQIRALREAAATEQAQAERTLHQAEALEQALREAHTALENARHAAAAQETAVQASASQRERAEQDALHADQVRCSLATQQATLHQNLLDTLSPYGLTLSAPPSEIDVLGALTERRDAWLNREKRRDALQRTLAELETALRHLAAQTLDREQELARHNEARRTLTAERDSLRHQRQGQLGEREPAAEERRLDALVENTENRLEQARKTLECAGQRLTALHSRSATLERALAERLAQLAPLEQDFQLRLTRGGFADEADYCSAVLPEATRKALSLKEQGLLTERAEQQARLKDTTSRLEVEREKRLTEQPREALAETLAQYAEELNSRQEAVGSLRRQLEEDQKTRQAHQERAEAVAAQRRECLRWSTLHDLIGSADGKKYRNFVQVLTFDLMIEHANRQLRRMTDRYLLLRNKDQPLELDVIDAYQAGEIRSTKNLSGGESFIVSLALALGLSQMASKTVRVDSLFLDEGFGTLDEDTLDTALDTLAGLHRDGKLIGVISHVSTLKERIGTQIQVTPGTGGRSRISGPGCSHGEQS